MTPENLILLGNNKLNRINEHIPLNDPILRDLLARLPRNFNLKNFKEIKNYNHLDGSAEIHMQAFLQIVAETVFHYPNIYVSEKTIKPIIYKRPFVIVGSPGCLANVKSLGFKTFDAYWDESYDTMVDPEKRILAIMEIIKFICKKSIAELQELCYDMKDILEYNFNFYYTKLEKLELLRFDQACFNNLNLRYTI